MRKLWFYLSYGVDANKMELQFENILGVQLRCPHDPSSNLFLIHDPQELHLQATYRVLCYLKGSSKKRILFKRNNSFGLEAYTDADPAGSIVDRRSTMSCCTFPGGNLVTLRNKKKMWWLDDLLK